MIIGPKDLVPGKLYRSVGAILWGYPKEISLANIRNIGSERLSSGLVFLLCSRKLVNHKQSGLSVYWQYQLELLTCEVYPSICTAYTAKNTGYNLFEEWKLR